MKRDLIHIVLACSAGLLVIAGSDLLNRCSPESSKPNCVEQPSASLSLKNAAVVTNDRGHRPRVCGIRSRSALPDVIQCYEMKDGCTE